MLRFEPRGARILCGVMSAGHGVANRHAPGGAGRVLSEARRPMLALFGSVLREDFRPDSDVDVLIEFEPGARAGYLKLAAMEAGTR